MIMGINIYKFNKRVKNIIKNLHTPEQVGFIPETRENEQ